jgi:hypothetical protein
MNGRCYATLVLIAGIAVVACHDLPPAPRAAAPAAFDVGHPAALSREGDEEMIRQLDDLRKLIGELRAAGEMSDKSAEDLLARVAQLVALIEQGERKEFRLRLPELRDSIDHTPLSKLAMTKLVAAMDGIQNFLDQFMTAVILEPRAGSASSIRCPPFRFLAAAYDFFGNELTDVVFEWSSDISGSFVTSMSGSAASATLPAGTHLLRVEAIRIVSGASVRASTAAWMYVAQGHPITFDFLDDMPAGEVGSGLQGAVNVTLPSSILPALVRVRSLDHRLLLVASYVFTEGQPNGEASYQQSTEEHAYVVQALEDQVGPVSISVEAQSSTGVLACGLQTVQVVRPAIELTLAPPQGQQEILIGGNGPTPTGLRVGLPSPNWDAACSCPESVGLQQSVRAKNSSPLLRVTLTATAPVEVALPSTRPTLASQVMAVFPSARPEAPDAAWIYLRRTGIGTVSATSPGFIPTKRASVTFAR